MKKIFTFFIIFFLNISYFLFPIVTSAVDKVFDIDSQTEYLVNEAGKTSINQNLTLKNLTNDHYVPEYQITLELGNIENIWAKTDSGRDIPFTTTKEDKKLIVDFDFNALVVAPQTSFTWNLGYTSDDITEKKGQIYEVTIPKMANLDQFNSYNLILKVSNKIGQKSYVSPNPETETTEGEYYMYTCAKEDLVKNSVIAAFGKYQSFDFTLRYQLNNPTNEKVYTEIAFPSDKNNQEVFLETIDPSPINTRLDNDDNILGYYELEANTKFQVVVSGYAKVWLLENDLSKSGKLSDISKDLAIYTKALPYWEVNDPEIKNIANEITKDQEKVADKAKSIFKYVTENLVYNDARLTENPYRFGAKEALSKKDQAVCMEFADLYIALARSSGIPAREIDGYAYNAKDNIGYIDALHAWVEVYIPPFGWLPIDPTWSSTASSLDYFSKLDTNHLALVTKGISSETPYPPGTYKKDSGKEGNIMVSFSDVQREIAANVSLELFPISGFLKNQKELQISGIIPQNVKLIITNNSAFTIYNGIVELKSNSLKIRNSEVLKNLTISPYGKKELTVSLINPQFWSMDKVDMNISFTAKDLLGNEYTKTATSSLKLSPFLWNLIPILIGILGGILLIGSIFFVFSLQEKSHKRAKRKKNKR
ncbi:hypothetical protein A2476_01950 [candidate division CPR3 bacterium RIFOXYC2_FULL_35_7]|nr:MAG: hypothetical protein A2476_01950 [candidate division CPR3 bacterium RIFOXYC2_FULL_35_7]